ncbi:MAG: hypothetical protein FD180_1952 [Planctomycetota bacterium]|nr:MAG: hypothetical protein FD180_1952 [Planctomycetota bacterium]
MREVLEESDAPPRFEDLLRAGLAGGFSQILVAAGMPVRARLGSGVFSFKRHATPGGVAAWTREVLGEAACGELEESGQVERDLVVLPWMPVTVIVAKSLAGTHLVANFPGSAIERSPSPPVPVQEVPKLPGTPVYGESACLVPLRAILSLALDEERRLLGEPEPLEREVAALESALSGMPADLKRLEREATLRHSRKQLSAAKARLTAASAVVAQITEIIERALVETDPLKLRDLVAAARFTLALERRSGFDGGALGGAGALALLPKSGPRPSWKAAKKIPPPETTEDGL